jgi:hypothetical protein
MKAWRVILQVFSEVAVENKLRDAVALISDYSEEEVWECPECKVI